MRITRVVQQAAERMVGVGGLVVQLQRAVEQLRSCNFRTLRLGVDLELKVKHIWSLMVGKSGNERQRACNCLRGGHLERLLIATLIHDCQCTVGHCQWLLGI